MKRINWQRLATIGLCSSLVINAFSGVTAIAETVTSESSPTVANSIKEATPASSARKYGKQSKTTETSQEEVTQETAKQAETKAPLETPEIKQTQQNNLQKIVVKMTDKRVFRHVGCRIIK